jgi:hypothetical protein
MTELQAKFAPDSEQPFPFPFAGTKPIYFYPSLAQSQREYTFYEYEEECDGLSDPYGGCIGIQREYRWRSSYWAFYRSGVKRVGDSLQCGWITVQYGCNWDYQKDKAFLGIGIGGDSGQGGTWPYSNETLNLRATAVISADGTRYD